MQERKYTKADMQQLFDEVNTPFENDERDFYLTAGFLAFSKLYDSWPKESLAFKHWGTPTQLRNSGVSRKDADIALVIVDVHSLMSINTLIVCWRAEQLSRTLIRELDGGNLLVSANLARALIEHTSAFLVESNDLRDAWEQWITEMDQITPKSALQFRDGILSQVSQFTFGTRDPINLKHTSGDNDDSFKRINVLDFVDKAGKLIGAKYFRAYYDQLCDAVHPSFGANDIFIDKYESPANAQGMQMVFKAYPDNERSQLTRTVRITAGLALYQLTPALEQHKTFCEDISSKFKLWCTGENYFGIAQPKWSPNRNTTKQPKEE